MILYRYLAKEVLLTTSAIMGVLLFIFLCNELVHYLGYIADGKFASWILLALLMVQVPIMLGILLPLGFFLGMLLAYGRLYIDSEMVVIFASGFSRRRLIIFTLMLAMVLAIIAAIATLWLNPKLFKEQDLLISRAKASASIEKIFPGQFLSPDGKQVYYVESISRDRKNMKNIFFAKPLPCQGDNKGAYCHHRWSILFATRGYQTRKNGSRFLIMTNGHRYQGIPGEKNYQIIAYKRYGHRFIASTSNKTKDDAQVMPTSTLWHQSADNNENASELQWRLSIPLAVLILGILALPLSRINPKHGRFTRLLPAVLIAIIYINMLLLARDWLSAGYIPSWLGMWWVHLLLLLLVVLLMVQWSGWQIFKAK